jgi:hypothetical protein
MLRHTFGTTMLDAGVDLRDVQIAARHAQSELPGLGNIPEGNAMSDGGHNLAIRGEHDIPHVA